LALRKLEALLVIVLFMNYASTGLATGAHTSTGTHQSAYEFVSPMPQFFNEAPSLNFTVPYPVPRPTAVVGKVNVLIIAVEFKGFNHTLSIEQVTNQTITQLDHYYSEVSYGTVSITGKVVGWIRLPYGMADYGADNGPFIDDQEGHGYPDTWRLLRDALPIAEKEVNVADYQRVVVLHAGYGEESSGVADDIWSVTFMSWRIETPGGTVDRFSIVPEFEAHGLSTTGVYAHEFGHLLGLPDLYSTQAEEVGPWDLMARGAWNGKPRGSSPAEFTAWDRIFLGWITPEHIVNVTKQVRMNVTLGPIELASSGVQAIEVETSPQDSNHYYLVEVRERIEFDTALPSSGVLITYVDETKSTPVRVIDAVQTSSTLDDATFQVGQKYTDSKNSLVISVGNTNGSSYSVVVDTTSPSPDVVVRSLTVNPQTVHPNDTASVSVVIANEGTLNAKPFLVNLYLNDTLFLSRQIALNVGQVQEMQSTWTPAKPGVYIFKAVVDPENVLQQASKENRTKVLTVVVGHSLTLEMRPPGAGANTQWWLVVNGVNQTLVGIGKFQFGVVLGTNTLQIQPIIYLGPDSRCVFRQWSDGSVSNPRTIQVSTDISLSPDFSEQFLLSLRPSGGSTSPGGWYDSGSPVTVSATSPSSVADRQSRLVFEKWSGDIDSNSTSIIINMTRPYQIIANWKIQYYLYVESPYNTLGEGWYDADTQAVVSLSSTIAAENGTRHVFVQWAGDLSGVDTSKTVTMSGPKHVSAVWVEQYELKIESEYGHTNGAGWFHPGTKATFIVDTPIIDAGNGTRRVFRGWSVDAAGTDPQSAIVMDDPKMVRANWGTQYQLIFTTLGIRNGTTLTITVDGQPYKIKVPETVILWHDAGSPVSFSSNATLAESFRRYVFQEWRNSTGAPVTSAQDVFEPEAYTAVYKEGSMFPCIIATVTFGSEASPEVEFLRNFRDRLVLSTRAGSAFMTVFNLWYYSFSPQVANFIASHETTRSPIRIALYPLIDILELSSGTYSALAFSPELAIVAAGVLASALIGLVYLTAIDLYVVRLLSRKRISGIHVVKAFSVSCLFALVALVLGELTGSFELLAVASSTVVLTMLASMPLFFSFLLMRLGRSLAFLIRMKVHMSR
jgi:M6 family metalloprotease-like protein